MRKIKAFCSIVLVIASMTVFSLASVPEVASADTPTEEDFEFMEWVINTIESFDLYSELSRSALEDKDYEALEVWEGLQYFQLKDALNEIDQFDVSAEIQPLKDEFKLYLQDKKQSSYYLRRYAKYRDIDDFDACISYQESANEHLGRFTYLLQSAKESAAPTPEVTPSPEKDSDGDGVPDEYDYAPNDPNVQTKEDIKTPEFGAIFAIGSLLAVAYLVLRRRRK